MKRSLSVESERQQIRSSHDFVSNASPVRQAFVDNRESAANLRQLKAAMANSLQVAALGKISQLMNNSPRLFAQRKMLSGEFVQRIEEEEPLQGRFTALQRAEEEEPVQGRFETVQRIEEEEPLQKKSEPIQRVEEEELQKKAATDSPAQLKEQSSTQTNNTANNTGLPDNLKSGIENLSGMSMDSVRVHYNSSQPAQLSALAYAQGTDIHVAPGQEQHLPHEAWHVVQQAQGRVQPTMQMTDRVPINDDKGLEHEADVMGAKAVQMMRERKNQPESISSQYMDNVISSSTVQRAEVPEDITDHQTELEEVISDIEGIEGPQGTTDEPLVDTIGGAENWASETRYAAKRKYVEFKRAVEAHGSGATDILMGEDTTTQSDVEYSDINNQWVWEESKLVNGSWPQFGVNVLAAREQLAGRTQKGGKGVASIQLTEDFYKKAQDELGLNAATVEKRCVEYLTKTMRKKFPSKKNTQFSVKLISYKGSQAEYDVTKWHQ